MKIPICDDVPDAAVQLTKIIALSFPDAIIHATHSGAEALEFIHSGKIPDIIFLDIIMPGIDGISLARTIRNKGYKGPIVFMTSSNEYAAQSYELGIVNSEKVKSKVHLRIQRA